MAGCEMERTKKDQDLQDERICGIWGIKKSMAVGLAYRINMFTLRSQLCAVRDCVVLNCQPTRMIVRAAKLQLCFQTRHLL